MNEPPPVSIALEKLGIPHQVFRRVNLVTSLEQAARERGQRPEQVVRSILFCISEDEFVVDQPFPVPDQARDIPIIMTIAIR